MKRTRTPQASAMRRICVIRHGYYPDDVRVRKEVHTLREAGYAVDVVCLRCKGQKTRENVQGKLQELLPHTLKHGNPGIRLRLPPALRSGQVSPSHGTKALRVRQSLWAMWILLGSPARRIARCAR